jgi:hypothetical protein
MRMLYMAHSGLRYLVLLLGIVSVVVLLYSVLAKKPVPAARGLAMGYTGALHLQVLLGIALIIAGVWYGALMGHIVMMLLAVIAAQGSAILAKQTEDPVRANRARLYGIIASMGLIFYGIVAIGRTLFESRAMTVGG